MTEDIEIREESIGGTPWPGTVADQRIPAP
jgi:hypothetical protein